MKILTNKHLFCRELGGLLFHVPALLRWASAKGLHLRTVPAIDDYDMVQVESMLCAIERGAEPNLDDAMDMVESMPHLAGHRMAEDAHGCRWLVGANAHLQWRGILTKAIDDGELQVFDAVSLLPTSMQNAHAGALENAAPEVTPDDGDEQTDTPPMEQKAYSMPRQRSQEIEILQKISELGYKANALPKRVPGKAWVKAEVKRELPYLTDSVFKLAWERLRKDNKIREAV